MAIEELERLSPSNNLMDKINTWNQLPFSSGAKNVAKRIVLTRAAAIPVVVIDTAELALRTIALLGQTILSVTAKPTMWAANKIKYLAFKSEIESKKFTGFNEATLNPLQVLETAVKVFKLALGVLSTAVFGVFFSPALNYKIRHDLLKVTQKPKPAAKEEQKEETSKVEETKKSSKTKKTQPNPAPKKPTSTTQQRKRTQSSPTPTPSLSPATGFVTDSQITSTTPQ